MATSQLVGKTTILTEDGPKKVTVTSGNLKSFVPYGDRIVVLPAAPPGTTPGGLILPDTVDEDILKVGSIVATGPDVEGEVEPDRYFAFHRSVGTPITIKKTKYLVMRFQDIWGEVEL